MRESNQERSGFHFFCCPRCGKTPLFFGWYGMEARCDACGLQYEREPGFFLVAMYASYFVQYVLLVPAYMVLSYLGWSYLETIAILFAALVLASPLVFRVSRWLWIRVALRIF